MPSPVQQNQVNASAYSETDISVRSEPASVQKPVVGSPPHSPCTVGCDLRRGPQRPEPPARTHPSPSLPAGTHDPRPPHTPSRPFAPRAGGSRPLLATSPRPPRRHYPAGGGPRREEERRSGGAGLRGPARGLGTSLPRAVLYFPPSGVCDSALRDCGEESKNPKREEKENTPPDPNPPRAGEGAQEAGPGGRRWRLEGGGGAEEPPGCRLPSSPLSSPLPPEGVGRGRPGGRAEVAKRPADRQPASARGPMASLYQRFTGKINTSQSFPAPPEASRLLGGQGPEDDSAGPKPLGAQAPTAAPRERGGGGGSGGGGAGGRPRFQYQARSDCDDEDRVCQQRRPGVGGLRAQQPIEAPSRRN
ncbi:A-type potassium channel modulatory protein DPP6, partial [Pteropus medius]|uniref:dipeptidyl aminopeptidase-like protein 6 n=1 Tax=Pteropus vampyrus TaxID=132908 RepID=UPI00196A380C